MEKITSKNTNRRSRDTNADKTTALLSHPRNNGLTNRHIGIHGNSLELALSPRKLNKTKFRE